jgi:hypothetical protein
MAERRQTVSRRVVEPTYTLPEWHDLPWLFRTGVLFNLWLHGAPSTQFNVMIGALLSFGTFWLYVILAIKAKDIDSTAFGLWLALVAAWGGFTVYQFKTKRETDHDALAIKHGQPIVAVESAEEVSTTGDVKITQTREGT